MDNSTYIDKANEAFAEAFEEDHANNTLDNISPVKHVILISGYKRSGKDFTAGLIAKELNRRGESALVTSFAHPLKFIAAATLGITLPDLELYKNNPDTYNLQVHNTKLSKPLHTSSLRKVLQLLGTEAVKPVFGENVWAELMKAKIDASPESYIIIPDYRFDAEFEYLSKFDYALHTLYIHNEHSTAEDNHSSETLPAKYPQYVIDNSDKTSLIHLRVEEYLNNLTKKGKL